MDPSPTTWAIIAASYPPQTGGISGNTWTLAHALVAAGDEVHVLAPGSGLNELESPVHVHRLSDHFGRDGRRALFAILASLPAPRRALVQFDALTFGIDRGRRPRDLNIPFVRALQRLRGYPLWIVFHEFDRRERPPTALLHHVFDAGAGILTGVAARAADAAFVSTTAFVTPLSRAAPLCPVRWIPIPSNIATEAEPQEVARLNARYRPAGGAIVGHFGTYRMLASRRMLAQVVPALCRAGTSRRILLLGRNSDTFAAEIVARNPDLAGAVHGTGELGAQDVANHLKLCDAVVLPFWDGATTRRTTLMSALALGIPTVTTQGRLTESFWEASNAVLFAPPDDVHAMHALTERVLANGTLRADIGLAARQLYHRRFAIDHAVRALRSADER